MINSNDNNAQNQEEKECITNEELKFYKLFLTIINKEV